MSPTRALLLATLVLLAGTVGGISTVAGQEDRVTMTVAVETPEGTPVGDARLAASWDGGSTVERTASNGKTFVDVPAGAEVSIRVSHPDYVRNTLFRVADASEREVTMTVHPKASARVAVEDADGPVPDAQVTVSKSGVEVASGTTGEDGTFDTGTIEEGLYTVTVAKAGYFGHREDVDLIGDRRIPITIDRGTVTLEVNVTDDHFDQPEPVGGATVNVEGSGSVTTQPAGIGRISVPVNTWANLEVRKEGYETTAQSVYVGERDAQVDLSVQRTPAISLDLLSQRVVIGERVSLEVSDEYGDPVADATVRLDGEAVTETDESGQAVVQIDSTGDHTVVVEKDSLSTEEHTVVGVEEGGATTTSTTAAPTETTADEGQPGFGPVVALLALLVAVGIGGRRVRR